jgi:thiol-disulfide isomerase/thioredoxin
MLSRRGIIAATAGLAAAAGTGNSALAQIDAGDLPPASDGLQGAAPVPAPALRFLDEAGAHKTLADYAGHGLVVNLWATWCGPCVAEIPSFAAVAPVLRRSGILVLPISIDINGLAAVKPFYARTGITGLPILLDTSGGTMDTLNANGVPVTVIINAAGQMVARVDGAADWNTPGTIKALRILTGVQPPHSNIQPV